MCGEFLAPDPGQEFVQFSRQLIGLLDEGGNDGLRFFIRYLHQHLGNAYEVTTLHRHC